MRIAVAIKQVPAASESATDMEHGFVIRTGRKRLNPYDGPAVEAALRLRDLFGGQVDVYSMGPESAVEVVTEALSMGADQGWLMTDKALAGADSLITARTLVEGFKCGGPYDLYIFGQKTTDGDTGQVGPSVASFLRAPFVGRVISFDHADERGLDLQHIADDMLQVARVAFPAVISVVRESFVPRIPTLKMKMRKKTVNGLKLADLENKDPLLFGSKGSPTKIKRVYYPERPAKGQVTSVSPGEASGKILKAVEALYEPHQ